VFLQSDFSKLILIVGIISCASFTWPWLICDIYNGFCYWIIILPNNGLYELSALNLVYTLDQLRPCLDAYVSISIHVCWGGLVPQHIWIEVDTWASKQGLQWFMWPKCLNAGIRPGFMTCTVELTANKYLTAKTLIILSEERMKVKELLNICRLILLGDWALVFC